ncbi:E3 ubiquitin-protein ligase RNF170-like [Quercus lobata]|uniref:E3 ubiquitin-protein ligase RNF170-like n=1 Tax=Quercus lobata TaxID=97700 RepID=UPI00124430A0|nr:E3 ubiquitin-protein ligase RNF170-like [Quercus lobata]
MDDPLANDCCSVCRSSFNIPCQANCSHWFCGNCIMQVWHHGSELQPCKCPLCRRQITLLVPGEASLRRHRDPEVAEILRKVETYNRRFGGRSNGLIQRMQDLPFLLRRLLRELMDPQRSLPLVIRARVYIAMILSAVYVLSPVDIIPEGIVGIVGLLDDLLIVLICFLHVAAIYRSVLYFRHGGS